MSLWCRFLSATGCTRRKTFLSCLESRKALFANGSREANRPGKIPQREGENWFGTPRALALLRRLPMLFWSACAKRRLAVMKARFDSVGAWQWLSAPRLFVTPGNGSNDRCECLTFQSLEKNVVKTLANPKKQVK